jgi:hypothetical protein
MAVFNELENKGVVKGILLFIHRMSTCKPGYSIERKKDIIFIRTSNNFIIRYKDINPFILK